MYLEKKMHISYLGGFFVFNFLFCLNWSVDLSHTADIQLHSWGRDLKEAFEQAAICMFGYMTELSKVDVDFSACFEINVSGHDLESLLFRFLDELLFVFSTDRIVCRNVIIQEFNMNSFSIVATCFGERFSLDKHPQGTEIKAITFSNMQIHSHPEKSEIFVIVDI